YTNRRGGYQQLPQRPAVSLALQGKNFPGFLGLFHTLIQGLLGGLLGLVHPVLAPQDARQVQVGLAVRRQGGRLAVVLDRQCRLIGEIVALPQRKVGLVVRLQHALVQALLDDRDAFLLVAFGVHVQGVEVAILPVLGERALRAHLLHQRNRLVVLPGLHVDRDEVHLQLLVVGA